MSNRAAKITYVAAGLAIAGLIFGAGYVVAGVVVAAPNPTPVMSVADPTPDPTGTQVSQPTSETREVSTRRSCAGDMYITTATWPGADKLAGEPVDTGAREFAAGTVERDGTGSLTSYTVAAGDAPSAIEERFCATMSVLSALNGAYGKPFNPEPGDRISLDIRDFSLN